MKVVDRTRMHVAFVVNNYPPHIGGVERHVKSLADALVALGDRVTVVTLASGDPERIEGGVRVLRHPSRLRIGDVLSFPLPGETRRLVRRLRADGVDVISTHTRFFPMSVVGMRVARRLGVPAIHTEHGSDFVRGVSPIVALGSRLVDVTLGRNVLRSVDRVLAVSEQVQAFVRRLAGVDSIVFYNAIDVDRWLSPPHRPERLAFVGRIVGGKGWDVLLDALEIIHGEYDISVDCDIYGEGPQSSALQSAVDHRGLGDRVALHGNVSPEVLARGLRGAVLVNPTILAEGFQTTIIETVAAGGQVVTYDVPGARALADDGAPVRIVEQGASALAAGIAAALKGPLPGYPPEKLRGWSWAMRGGEFRAIAAGLLGRRGTRATVD